MLYPNLSQHCQGLSFSHLIAKRQGLHSWVALYMRISKHDYETKPLGAAMMSRIQLRIIMLEAIRIRDAATSQREPLPCWHRMLSALGVSYRDAIASIIGSESQMLLNQIQRLTGMPGQNEMYRMGWCDTSQQPRLPVMASQSQSAPVAAPCPRTPPPLQGTQQPLRPAHRAAEYQSPSIMCRNIPMRASGGVQ